MIAINSSIPLINSKAQHVALNVFDPNQFATATGATKLLWMESRYIYNKDVAYPANGTVLGGVGTRPINLFAPANNINLLGSGPTWNLPSKLINFTSSQALSEATSSNIQGASTAVMAFKGTAPTSYNGVGFCPLVAVYASNFWHFVLFSQTNILFIATQSDSVNSGNAAFRNLGAHASGASLDVVVAANCLTGSIQAIVNGSYITFTNTFINTTFQSATQLYMNSRPEGGAGAYTTKHVSLYKAGTFTKANLEKLYNYICTIP